jgi:predicted PurR-regulated permease PerM
LAKTQGRTQAAPQRGEERRSAAATLRIGVLVMSVVAAGFAFWALRSIFAPFALAVFLLLMIDGLARAIATRLPRLQRLALPAAIVFIVAVFGFAIWLLAQNTRQFAHEAPAYTARINALLQRYSAKLGPDAPASIGDLVQQINPGHYIGMVAKPAGELVERSVFVLIYLGFLLASRQSFKRKAGVLFEGGARQAEAARVMDRVRRGVESYVWVQTVVGIVIAGLSLLIMWPMGLSHIFFFAVVIFLANYVPAIGAAIGVLIPPMFGLLEFDDLWRPIVMLVGLELVHFGVSHVLQPRLQGKTLNLDPIFVLLGLAFWGFLWGMTGAFLSTPLTVTVMALLAELPGARWAAVILSSDGKPYADETAAGGPDAERAAAAPEPAA